MAQDFLFSAGAENAALPAQGKADNAAESKKDESEMSAVRVRSNKSRFDGACRKIVGNERERAVIGTMKEKTLHAVLKHYFEEDEGCHEIKIASYFADIVGEDGIIEIQTSGFHRLRKKLTEFLDVARVTVVYPIPATKWLIWLDEDTGEVTNKRKSPRQGSVFQAFRELYSIRDLLQNENLTVAILLIDIEETRLLCGWSRDRKRGSVRYERIPVALREELHLGPGDYHRLLPPLPESFTSADFAKAAKISRRDAGTGLNLLNLMGAVRRVGKNGNAFLYERAES